ncbi:MAG: hypothetical protein DMF56_16515 [Acidobacteria bacterium]|nr:MAG: hypothetical protein DMF56_16515 [Acidobacteriota bacterium]
MRALIITPRARRQYERELRWWSRNRDKAPHLFGEEFDQTCRLILDAPGVGQRVQTRRSGNRRVLMEHTRYYIYYRVNTNDDIAVLSVWHASRRPPRL